MREANLVCRARALGLAVPGFNIPYLPMMEPTVQALRETGVDWLSVAVGSVHGAISATTRSEKKVAARLNIEHLEKIRAATGIPLVLHGGTGIRKECVLDAVRHGIAKINIATATRQPYERLKAESVVKAQQAVYEAAVALIRDELELAGSATVIKGAP